MIHGPSNVKFMNITIVCSIQLHIYLDIPFSFSATFLSPSRCFSVKQNSIKSEYTMVNIQQSKHYTFINSLPTSEAKDVTAQW